MEPELPNYILDFNQILGVPSINNQGIYQNIPSLKDEIENGYFSKDWLLELHQNYFDRLQDREIITLDGDIRVKIHPYLRRFMSCRHAINIDLIEELLSLHRGLPNLRIGIALDPSWSHPPEPILINLELERAFGVSFDLPRIIHNIRQDHGSIISVFFNPQGTEIDQIFGLRLPIRIRIELEEEDNQEILDFNIYEFSNWHCNNFVLCRSAHGLYSITADAFYHIDGKALLYRNIDYNPVVMAFRDTIRCPKRKLFRIQGDFTEGIFIPNEYFTAVTTRFFFANDLIREFFDPESIENNIRDNLEIVQAE